MDSSILYQFLKSGYLYEHNLFPTDQGTPQGGIISPILGNITLDGMENLIMDKFPKMKVHFVRYADVFVVTAPTKEIAEELKIISVVSMKPSKESVKKITRKIGDIIHRAAAWNQEQVIQILNPIIIGWTNYHRHIASTKTFDQMNSIIWNQLWQWAKRKHPDKGHKWIARWYWSKIGDRNWVFCTKEKKLRMFSETPIRRHFMVKLEMNPYLDHEYFISCMDRMRQRTPDVQVKLTYFPTCRPKLGL